jgi:hypothetical protein
MRHKGKDIVFLFVDFRNLYFLIFINKIYLSSVIYAKIFMPKSSIPKLYLKIEDQKWEIVFFELD